MHGDNDEFVDFVKQRLQDGINQRDIDVRADVLAKGFQELADKDEKGGVHCLIRDIVDAWQSYQLLESDE